MEEIEETMTMEEKVFSYIEKYNMIQTGSHVTAGLSGGADSICLLFLLKQYQNRRTFTLEAVHVNHGIRGAEAKRDERFSKDFCESLGIPFTACHYPVPEIASGQKISVEEAGRNVRREAFWQKALEAGAESYKVVALAHHKNDNAETVLHNLIRGTGAAGLGGIRPVQKEVGKGSYIRPLLCVQREEIEEYLREKQISWITDSTNEETEYTRNKIRHQVIPRLQEINAGAVSHIAETAQTLGKIEEYLQEQADILYREYVKKQGNRYCIDKQLSCEKEIMQSYVLMNVLAKAAGQRKDITAVHVEAVRKLFEGRTGAGVSLPYGLMAVQNYGDILVGNRKNTEKALLELEFEIFPYENQQIPEKTYTKWFDYDKIKCNLEIRRRLPGDYLTVNADGGRKKLKDYLIDCKIPREERESLTLLADGSHIVWIVGYRISEYYKVSNQTKKILKVHVKGEDKDE